MIYYRAILSELSRPFLMTFGVISFLLLMGKIQRMVTWMVDKRLDVDEVMLMFVYLLPSTFSFTIPLGVLGAVFMVVIRHSLDSELISYQAAGLSLRQYSKPFVTFGWTTAFITLFLTLLVQPLFNRKFLELQVQIIKSHAEDSLIPGEFNYDFGGKVIRIQDRNQAGEFVSVFLADRELNNGSSVIMADRGNIAVDEGFKKVIFKLQGGTIYTPQKEAGQLVTTHFDSLDYVLTLPTSLNVDTEEVELNWTIPTWELVRQVSRLDSGDVYNYTPLAFELFNRLTVPWICLAFALAAIPLAVVDPRSGRSGGYLRAIFLVMVYYLLWIGCRDLILAAKAPGLLLFSPAVAIWVYGWRRLKKMDRQVG
ncbi:MAG: LptF/LptG family permease [Deltaproteobacteria bacterium]|nr:LptF/LptG family permease [Deltaproteobacteria bacterium]